MRPPTGSAYFALSFAMLRYSAASAASELPCNFMINLRTTELCVRRTVGCSKKRDWTRFQFGGRRKSNSGESKAGAARSLTAPADGVGRATNSPIALSAGVCAQGKVQAAWVRQWWSPCDESDGAGACPSGQSRQSVIPLVVA